MNSNDAPSCNNCVNYDKKTMLCKIEVLYPCVLNPEREKKFKECKCAMRPSLWDKGIF